MATVPSTDDKDPIADKSLSWQLLIASALLVASTVWALYDEVIGRRPWKRYQSEFAAVYDKHLTALGPDQNEIVVVFNGVIPVLPQFERAVRIHADWKQAVAQVFEKTEKVRQKRVVRFFFFGRYALSKSIKTSQWTSSLTLYHTGERCPKHKTGPPARGA